LEQEPRKGSSTSSAAPVRISIKAPQPVILSKGSNLFTIGVVVDNVGSGMSKSNTDPEEFKPANVLDTPYVKAFLEDMYRDRIDWSRVDQAINETAKHKECFAKNLGCLDMIALILPRLRLAEPEACDLAVVSKEDADQLILAKFLVPSTRMLVCDLEPILDPGFEPSEESYEDTYKIRAYTAYRYENHAFTTVSIIGTKRGG
jgi:hypothetical protein